MAAAAAGGGGLTAEQKRLNPMLGSGSSQEKGAALAKQAAMQAVQNTIKRGVSKQNYDN